MKKQTRSLFSAWVKRRRRKIEKERAEIEKRLDAARPIIEGLAANGNAAERDVARRWLALDAKARGAVE